MGLGFESVTIKDIARELNLSTSTVSRALRGSHEISDETKMLVRACAERLNYRPNPIALSLKSKKSRSIGVVISEIANNYFSQAINGIESIAYNRGYHVIISQSHESKDRELANISHLASRGVDGLLVSLSSETEDTSQINEIIGKGLPMVFFDRIPAEIDSHKVVANNFKGAYEATKHLLEQGFKNIAHITNSSFLSISKERLAGYKAALNEFGVAADDRLIRYCPHGGMIVDEVKEALNSLFTLTQQPDAILTAGDRITTTCFGLLKQRSNQSIAICGFSNTPSGDLFSPSLSVVRQPAFETGEKATELLIRMIESKRPTVEFEMVMLDTELVVRESTGRR